MTVSQYVKSPASSCYSTGIAKRMLAAAIIAAMLLTSGCATQQGTGGVLGGALGAVTGAAAGAASRRGMKAIIIGAVTGAALGGFAGSVIGSRLDEADRKKAEAAAQLALAEREAAVQKAIAVRNAEIERQLRAELMAARSAAGRSEAERHAAEARQAALHEATARTPAPRVVWSGNARGSAQATGSVQVEGRTDCEQVREIAVIQGQEVRQVATFCRDPATGGRSRVV